MSYALTRRFAWIYVDVPADTSAFVRKFVARTQGVATILGEAVPLGQLWSVINEVRAIGPAPIIDIMKLIGAKNDTFDFLAPITNASQSETYLDGFSVFILPMLDGILREQGTKMAESLVSLFKLEGEAEVRLRTRIDGLTI